MYNVCALVGKINKKSIPGGMPTKKKKKALEIKRKRQKKEDSQIKEREQKKEEMERKK